MTRLLPFVCLLGLVGCSPSVDQQSSVKVMGAALVGTGQAQSQIMSSATASGSQFDAQVTNPAGSGSAHVSGSATSSAGSWTSAFDITYAHWLDAASNITLDGSLHESASFTSLDPIVGTAHLTGMLQASGAVQAEVDFDLSVTYTATGYSVTGSIGGNSINVSH
jgi:hypothetical protein